MILALDLGTTTGFAYGPADIVSGTWSLKPMTGADPATRFLQLEAHLMGVSISSGDEITKVYYEEVMQRPLSVYAGHIYGGLKATLGMWCVEHNIPREGVPVGTIKKHWTGRGNASKSEMVEEAIRRGYAPIDDNEADALALLHYGLDNHNG